MEQIEFFEIPSPCIGICQSGSKGFCIGCFRSREERLHWNVIDDDLKRKIIKAAANRRKRAEREARKRRENQEIQTSGQLDLDL